MAVEADSIRELKSRMSDPYYRPPEPRKPPSDQGFERALVRRHLLRIVSGGLAHTVIAAIWLVWRLD